MITLVDISLSVDKMMTTSQYRVIKKQQKYNIAAHNHDIQLLQQKPMPQF